MDNGGLSLVTVSKPKTVSTKVEFEMLSYFEQESRKFEMKSYNNIKMKLKNNPSSVYLVIWVQLTKGLQNHIIAHSDYTFVKQRKDAIKKLLGLVDKTCNMTSKIDNFSTQLCESMCMMSELKGNKLNLSNYYDHFKQRIKSADLAGFSVDSVKFMIALLD